MTRKTRLSQIPRSLKKMPLRWILVVPFVVQLVSAIGVFGYLSFKNERNTIESLAYELMGQANESVQSQLGSYLKTPYLLNQTSRNLIEQGTLRSSKDFQLFFARQVHSLNSIDYLAWGDRNGNYVDAARLAEGQLTSSVVDAARNRQFLTYQITPQGEPQKLLQNSGKYDPRTRPWYKAALEKRAATWSPIYVWFDNSKLAIDAVLPVYDAMGRDLGVLDVPLTLSKLSNFLHQLKAQHTGYYFIIEPSGALIATSTQEKLWLSEPGGIVKRRFAADSETPLIRATWQQLNSRSAKFSALAQQHLNFEWQGQRQYLQVSPIKEQGIDWVMVAVLPESSFMNQANANTHTTVLFGLVAFAIATGAAVLTAQWIARPILRLNASAKQFVQNFSSDPTTAPTNEVEELATSFQSISEQLQTVLQAQQNLNIELEQRVAERTQELAQANDRFEAFMNRSSVCAWITDASGKLLYVNQPYLQTFQPSNPEVIGKTVFDLFEADVAQAAFASTQTVAQTQESLEMVSKLPRQDGTLGEFLIYKFPITGAAEHPLVGGVALDITDLNRMEVALRNSEAHSSWLAAIVESSSDAILSKDLEGRILSWNAGAEQLFGYTAAEAIGQSITLLIPPEQRHDLAYDLQRIQQRHPGSFETQRVRKDGQLICVSITVSPIRDQAGKITAISAIYRDITEQKQTEEQLKNLSSRLTLALQSGTIGTWEWDFVHDVNWDDSMYELYGLSSLNHPATYQDWISAVHPEDRANTEAVLQAAVRGEREFDPEFRIIRPDGAIWFIKASALIQSDEEGKPQHMIGINYDITERKQAEQTLRENEQFLRSIYDGVEQAIFVVDVREDDEFYFVGINPAHERLSGLRSVDLEGKTPEQSLPAELAAAVRQRYQTCLETGETMTYEECLCFQDEPSWWITNLAPLRDQQSRIYRIVGTSININSRKHTEKQLELQDTIVRTMAEGVCLVRETDGTIVYANPKFEHLFGYAPGELNGQPVSRVNYEDGTIDSETIARKIMEGISRLGEYSYEIQNVKKDGTPFWCWATSSKFDHPEQGVVYVAVHQDITDRKALEQELAHQRHLLEQELAHNRQLLDTFITSAPVGMCVLDNQLRYTLVNEALAANNQRSAADHLGKTIWEIVPDFAAAQADVFRHALITGETTLGAEVVSEMPDCPGVKRTWLVSLFPIQTQTATALVFQVSDSDAAADSLGIIITEITERKQAEEQIKASLQEKEVLLQEIHHRVKNNLQIIDSLLQMQYRRTQEPNAAAILLESQHRIKSIALVHEKLYRSDDLAHIDFSDYVRSLVANLIDSYQTSSSRVTVLTQISNIVLNIDQAIPCGLIINELVSNAFKYAFPENQTGQIQISLEVSAPGWLTLTVADNGTGIPADIDLQKTKSLGLKMVRGLATQLAGTAEIHRQPGTLVQVSFPAGHTEEET